MAVRVVGGILIPTFLRARSLSRQSDRPEFTLSSKLATTVHLPAGRLGSLPYVYARLVSTRDASWLVAYVSTG